MKIIISTLKLTTDDAFTKTLVNVILRIYGKTSFERLSKMTKKLTVSVGT